MYFCFWWLKFHKWPVKLKLKLMTKICARDCFNMYSCVLIGYFNAASCLLFLVCSNVYHSMYITWVLFSAGSSVINVSYREQSFSCYPKGIKESPWQDKKFALCETHIWFSLLASCGKIFCCYFRCYAISSMCASTNLGTRRISNHYRFSSR